MRCIEIRELLITDYVDKRLSAERKAEIDRHLESCQSCKEFFAAVKQTAVEPFAGLGRVEPSEAVWRRTRQAIIEERTGNRFAAGFLARLRYIFSIPKPILAAISAAILIIAIGTVIGIHINNQGVLNASMQDQAEYLSSLTDAAEDMPVNAKTGLGTSIEKYFL